MNRPAGKAKQRKAKAPPRKPCVEPQDGLAFKRFEGIAETILSMTPSEAAGIRALAAKGVRRKRRASER